MALLIGIALASTFFAGIDIKANVTAMQALDEQLSSIYVDMQANMNQFNATQMLSVRDKVLDTPEIEDAEIITRASWMPISVVGKNDSETTVRIVAISNQSQVYDGWLNMPSNGIGADETYVPEGTQLASSLEIGDIVQANLTLYAPYDGQIVVTLNLTVKGFAQFDERASAIVSGYQSEILPILGTPQAREIQLELLLLVSWEKTIQGILPDQGLSQYQSTETDILIYLNRGLLINPWDAGVSINNVQVLQNSIENKLATNLGVYVDIQNNLEWPLRTFQVISLLLRFAFTLVSLPIFFMAWYMGTTVSDVSFNLRRREIGLLLTKGFSRGQILRTFLIETLLIGWIGGILGVFLGLLLNPLFTQFSANALLNPYLISPYTMVFTVAFGMIMAFLSTYRSARKASQLPTVDALREYLPTEAETLKKKRWPMLALILGTYKIAVFLLGLNMTNLSGRLIAGAGNFVFVLLIGIFIFLDAILNYIGPLLFFWGFTKLFIQGSLEFQELTARGAKFLGDIGVLATKNVRRNPARSAAIAFLIALIVGYSVQVTGQLASEQDYAVRQLYSRIGADIAVQVPFAEDAPEVLNTILANVSDRVENSTIEYSFSAYAVSFARVAIKAVEPQTWLKTAYYESEWFSGTDMMTAFSSLDSDKNSIILERNIAVSLNIALGENISLTFDSTSRELTLAGFFGPEPQPQTTFQQTTLQTWSFVSEGFYEEISTHVSSSARIFLKLKIGEDSKHIAENIRELEVGYVESFAEKWEEAQAEVITMGILDVQRLGIVFAVLAASVGTALISTVSMKERSREATIMSVKGLSYKQLIIMFLTENLALVIFSVILGIFVGSVTVYGNISASNAMIIDLVRRRLVFPLESAIMLTTCLILIFGATILPVLIMSRRYVTKLERMVRLR